MSVATNTLYACLNTQHILNDIAGESSPVMKMLDNLGTLKALKYSESFARTGLMIDSIKQRPASGTNRKVTVFGKVKTCPTVETSKPAVCTAVTAETTAEVDDDVLVSRWRGDSFTLDYTLYKSVCEGVSDALARKLRDTAESVIKAENNLFIADLLSDADTYVGGKSAAAGSADEKLVNLFSTAGTPQPTNMWTIIQEYRRKGYGDIVPVVIGGETVDKFLYDLGYYQGVNDSGFDFGKFPMNTPLFSDWNWDTVAQGASYANGDGASRLFSFIPGHVHRVYYLDYAEGSNERVEKESITKTTMDILGETFDVSIYEDDCNSKVTVTLGRWNDIYVIPSTFFTASCSGGQSLLSWTTDCADTSCTNVQLDHSAPGE